MRVQVLHRIILSLLFGSFVGVLFIYVQVFIIKAQYEDGLTYDESTTDTESLQYSPPYNTSIKGREFNVDMSLIQNLGLFSSSYVPLNMDTIQKFVFATGASAGYFRASLEAVATVQKHHPNYTIIYYDLGLKDSQKDQVKTLCGVVYRRFNFSLYPEHVQKLYTYAWKPIIIWEILREYNGVMWLDSSVKVIRSDLHRTFDGLFETHGGVLQSSTGHSTFAVTHEDMYQYLPTDIDMMKKNEQWEATVFIYRTRGMVQNVIRWLVLCSLDVKCIAPYLNRFCSFSQSDRFKNFAKCHRFDQSAINILLNNYHNFDNWHFYIPNSTIRVIRGFSNSAVPQYCR